MSYSTLVLLYVISLFVCLFFLFILLVSLNCLETLNNLSVIYLSLTHTHTYTLSTYLPIYLSVTFSVYIVKEVILTIHLFIINAIHTYICLTSKRSTMHSIMIDKISWNIIIIDSTICISEYTIRIIDHQSISQWLLSIKFPTL